MRAPELRSSSVGQALLVLLAAWVLPPAALSQSPPSWPLERAGSQAGAPWERYALRHSDLTALTRLDATTMHLELPSGTAAFSLQRVDLERLGFGYQLDGRPAPGLLADAELTVWRGTSLETDGGQALLGFGRHGAWGWVQAAGSTWHLLTAEPPGGDWSAAEVLVVRERALADLDWKPAFECEVARPTPPPPTTQRPERTTPTGATSKSLGLDLLEAAVAVETDDQFYDLFGDPVAAASYLTTLLAAVSERFEGQVGVVLTFPYVQLHTQGNDPWSTPDVLGSTGDMLDEFQAAWAGAIPNGARLGHFVSGADLGGGIAYVGVLCDADQSHSFAVSADMTGQTPLPIVAGPLNWDFVVFAHETGHNFDSPHTHDHVPPIDDCAGGACIPDGTLMSYCHLCPGGMSNNTTYFHEPTIVGIMRTHAEACLDPHTAVVWVDFAHTGAETGTFLQPFDSVAEALAVVAAGDVVRIKAGSSSETLTADQPVSVEANGGAVTLGAP